MTEPLQIANWVENIWIWSHETEFKTWKSYKNKVRLNFPWCLKKSAIRKGNIQLQLSMWFALEMYTLPQSWNWIQNNVQTHKLSELVRLALVVIVEVHMSGEFILLVINKSCIHTYVFSVNSIKITCVVVKWKYSIVFRGFKKSKQSRRILLFKKRKRYMTNINMAAHNIWDIQLSNYLTTKFFLQTVSKENSKYLAHWKSIGEYAWQFF